MFHGHSAPFVYISILCNVIVMLWPCSWFFEYVTNQTETNIVCKEIIYLGQKLRIKYGLIIDSIQGSKTGSWIVQIRDRNPAVCFIPECCVVSIHIKIMTVIYDDKISISQLLLKGIDILYNVIPVLITYNILRTF